MAARRRSHRRLLNPALTGDGALVVGVTDGRLLAIGPS